MRRQALDRERARDTYFAPILIGPVDEVFDFGIACDRVIDLSLPLRPHFPPLAVQLSGLRGPMIVGLARQLPFLPGLIRCLVQSIKQRPKRRLPLLPDDIDFGVARDVAQLDVRDALVDEALPDRVAKWAILRRPSG